MPYADIAKQREYQRNWMRERRMEYLGDKTCADCGTDKDLELHHRDPSQKVSHKIFSWRAERLQTELAKCDIVCSECHDDRHKVPPQHGKHSTYRKHGCRCLPCLAAYRVYAGHRNVRRRLKRRARRLYA